MKKIIISTLLCFSLGSIYAPHKEETNNSWWDTVVNEGTSALQQLGVIAQAQAAPAADEFDYDQSYGDDDFVLITPDKEDNTIIMIEDSNPLKGEPGQERRKIRFNEEVQVATAYTPNLQESSKEMHKRGLAHDFSRQQKTEHLKYKTKKSAPIYKFLTQEERKKMDPEKLKKYIRALKMKVARLHSIAQVQELSDIQQYLLKGYQKILAEEEEEANPSQ